MDVSTIVAEDRIAWDELVSVLETHPQELLHAPSSPWQWTSRDVYAHLARWISHSTEEMQAVLDGDPPLPPLEGTDDEINARWQREDSSLNLPEARQLANAAFDRRVQLLSGILFDRWDSRLERLAGLDGAEHYRAHRAYIVLS